MELFYLTAGALLLCAATTPVARWAGRKWNAVSHPDGERRLQAEPIPQSGGLAILVSLVTAFAVFVSCTAEGQSSAHLFAGIAASATFLCALGLADDILELSGKLRLLLQTACFLPTLAVLPVPETWTLYGAEMPLGPFAILFTAFWLLLACNATNLIDGMDGLAGGCGLLVAGSVGVTACCLGHAELAAIGLITAACCGGFLVHNLPPAKIYLGDCGSTVIGFLLGVISLQAATLGGGELSVVAVPLLMLLPLLDTSLAIARRWMRGESIMSADRAHVHHRLQDKGLSVRQSLVILIGIAAWGCGLAAVALLGADAIATALTLVTLAALVATKTAGYTEWSLFTRQLAAWTNWLPTRSQQSEPLQELAIWRGNSRQGRGADSDNDEAAQPVFNKAA